VPVAVQRESGLAEGSEVAIRTLGPGVVLIESVEAIKDRIRGAAPRGVYDSVADVRAERDASDRLPLASDEELTAKPDEHDGDPGRDLLRSLGLE
jgi:hypothetical protein